MKQTMNSFPIYPVCDSSIFCLSRLRNYENEYGQQIWENPQTRQSYQEHIIMTPSTVTYSNEMETYEWRRLQEQFIVRVCYVEQLDESFGFRQLRVFVEKTKKLLERTGKFDWNQGLDILKNCLKGYQKVYKRFGLLSVTDGMITIDEKNKPKVWININFARNTYMYYDTLQDDKKDENSMIRGVYKAMEPHLKYNQSLANLRNMIESANSFENAFNIIETMYYQQRIPMILSQKPSIEKRKYFSKTPENDLKNQKKLSPNYVAKQSYAYNRQNSYKNVPIRPNVLEFRQVSQKGKKTSLNKKNSLHENNIDRKLNYVELKKNERSITPNRIESGAYTFASMDQKKQRNYFGSGKNSVNRLSEKSKQKQLSKKSSSSREISFKSQHNKQLNGSDCKLTPLNLLQRFGRKRTGSQFNRSPSPMTVDDRFQTSQSMNPIVKSMTIIKKQLQILNRMRLKDYTKQSTSDLDNENSGLESFRNSKTAFQFPGVKLVKESTIQEQYQITPSKTIQLKNSLFNRVDDLKKSEIIVENSEQQQLSRISTQSVYKLPPKPQTKLLRKMSNKPMTQSITLQNKHPPQQTAVYMQMALDRFAKVRTESRLHEPINSLSDPFVPIRESIEEQF